VTRKKHHYPQKGNKGRPCQEREKKGSAYFSERAFSGSGHYFRAMGKGVVEGKCFTQAKARKRQKDVFINISFKERRREEH